MDAKKKSSCVKTLTAEGFEQHSLNKNLFLKTIGEIQYGIDLKGYEAVIFKIKGGSERDPDPSDPVITDLANKLGTQPGNERAAPMRDSLTEEETDAYDNAGDDHSEPEEYEAEFSEEPIETIDPIVEEPEKESEKKDNTLPPEDGVQYMYTIQNMEPRLPEVGKIKIGQKGETIESSGKKSFKKPVKLNYFRVVTNERENGHGNFMLDQAVMDRLGPEPTEIPIVLPYDDIALNFQSSYAWFNVSVCKCRGNGKTATRDLEGIIPCNPETCPQFADKLCKPSGVLSVMIMDAPRIGGVYKFRTTGWNSIRNIMSSLMFLSTMNGGTLAGIPLLLKLYPKKVTLKTGMNTTIYMVNVEYQGSLNELRTKAKDELLLRSALRQNLPALEAAAVENLKKPITQEEVREITEEFYPELYTKQGGN